MSMDIDEQVARKLGYRVGRFKKDGKEYFAIKSKDSPDFPMFMDSWGQLPSYSADIEAAWEIVRKCVDDGADVLIHEGIWGEGRLVQADIYRGNEWAYQAKEETAPMAICRAFLRLP